MSSNLCPFMSLGKLLKQRIWKFKLNINFLCFSNPYQINNQIRFYLLGNSRGRNTKKNLD